MSEWAETTLGALFMVDNSKLGAHEVEPTVMSLSKYAGFVRAEDYFDKRIASIKLDGYKTVAPGEWAFSTIHVDEGSIARNNLGRDGRHQPRCTRRCAGSARGLCRNTRKLLVREPRMLAEYTSRAQGSINRRRSLPFKKFASIPVVLPPMSEQRRIVNVMSAVDAQIAALAVEAETLLVVVRLRRAELVNDEAVPEVRAEQAFEFLDRSATNS